LVDAVEDSALVGMIFLKKMFCETNTMVEPNAQMSPNTFDKEKSTDVASITPNVRGRSETYVGKEYFTPNSRAYARTVKRGESAYKVVSAMSFLF
jgi:hypothetical protein